MVRARVVVTKMVTRKTKILIVIIIITLTINNNSIS